MANKVEILWEVDPTGQGQAGVRRAVLTIRSLEDAENSAARTSRGFMDVFKGQLLADFFQRGTAAVYEFGQVSLEAYTAGVRSTRLLDSIAREAGLSLDKAQGDAQAFADILALTETQGEETYAAIVRLARGAGELDKVNEIAKGFADVAAARGLSATQLADRARQLQNLVDEGTDALFGVNPETIYKQYAAATGKAAGALSDMEKRQAIVNELLKVAEGNAGSAAARLGDAEGRVSALSSAFADFQRNAGQVVATQTPLLDFFDLLNAKLRGEGGSPGEILQRRYAEAFAAQNAQAQAQARADLDKQLRDLQIQSELNRGTITGDFDAEFKSFRHLELSRGAEEAARLRDTIKNNFTNLFKTGRDDIGLLRLAEEEFKKVGEIFDGKDAQEIGDKLNALIKRQVDRGLDYLRGVRKAAEGELKTFGEAFAEGRANPFVAIFGEAEEAARKLRETFGALEETEFGRRQLAALEGAQSRITNLKLANARVDAELHAERLRRDAEALNSLQGLTAAQERQLDITNRQINAALRVPELLGRAGAIERGQFAIPTGSQFQAQVLNEQLEGLRRLQRDALGESGEFGERNSSAVDQAIIRFFESLPEQFQRQAVTGQNRDFFAGAFRREAGEQQREVERAIENARAAERAIDRISAELEIVRRGGLPSAQEDARILAITGGLDPRELAGRPDLRNARFDALLREADRKGTDEAEARQLIQEQRDATDRLTAAVDELARAAGDPENRRLLVEIIDRADAAWVYDDAGSLNPGAARINSR